ncbi:nuclear pore complex NUP88 [Olea europaea subsp. europaea]|uniref:Nuclear pore complex NUP88 n=1 Tax=Olea europaea subsp. europaea TaxID=158383 RepID=A0A8S0V2N7_OLEEU|nr:nuclear pore complex NUP88 [Olea europaea subsp. europaea]
MRFGFDVSDSGEKSQGGPQSVTPPSSIPSSKAEIQWVPLQNHPLFSSTAENVGDSSMPRNLMTWDGASRLYFWDSNKMCLHRISIRLGEPDPGSILAASPSKVLQADAPLTFHVDKIFVNRNGSALLLAGSEGFCVMYLYGRSSMEENIIICRTVSIGSEIYFNRNNCIRTLQISWHPCSDTHIGILSSDSVFRIFDLSSALEQPEQEYYLQPVEPGSSSKAASICPVDFSFGGDHLWDRFSVFILFSDGSLYILCPIVPFGSLHKWESILEIYNDAHTFGMKSSNSKAVTNSNLAISWLEATFPGLAHQAGEGGNLFAIKAQPYVLFDASISLQGPLRDVYHSLGEDSEVQRGVCEGRAVSFLYNLVSKDSILVTAWSGGQLRIDALADEIQPVWKVGSAPRVCVNSYGHILGVAMICESVPTGFSVLKFDQPQNHTAWLGHPPPLLRLAIVDLALPMKNDLLISMIADPIIGERIYCLHNEGIDSIVLHFLPFTSQASGKEEAMKTPAVHAVLSTCSGKSSRTSSLHGFLALSDSFGSSWIVGIAASQECIVLQMETWNLLLTHTTEKEMSPVLFEELKEIDTPTIISKELLAGPKAVILPHSEPNLRSVTADSIEGRATLHQYFKLFHENYMEYAHKVYFELEHHAPHLKKIIGNQHSRLRESQQKLLEVETKQEKVESRIERAVQLHNSLEERLHKLTSLSGLQKKRLSKAEQDFKLELDRFTGVELDALHSSIEALNARLGRHVHSPQTNFSNQQRQKSRSMASRVQEEVSQLKSSLAKLSLLNSENTQKVKLVESALKNRDISDR